MEVVIVYVERMKQATLTREEKDQLIDIIIIIIFFKIWLLKKEMVKGWLPTKTGFIFVDSVKRFQIKI